MSSIKVQDLDSQLVPLFARYLEGQICEDLSIKRMTDVSKSTGFVINKYPFHQEDGGVEIVTNKFHVLASTLKYPSDQEDGSGLTRKYASDADDAVSHLDCIQ